MLLFMWGKSLDNIWVVLKPYSWLCALGLLLSVHVGPYVMLRVKLDLAVCKASVLLYYYFSFSYLIAIT